jgi:hypothetical protein
MLLLSDGRVMVQEDGTPQWYALTPDADGSYVKGTWSPLADMAIWRRYYASGMLKDVALASGLAASGRCCVLRVSRWAVHDRRASFRGLHHLRSGDELMVDSGRSAGSDQRRDLDFAA